MMIMQSVHKRMDNPSLPALLGLVVILIVGCIIITINKVVNIVKAK